MRKSAGWVVWLQSVQWMVFLLANVVAVPIMVGAAFDLPAADISTFVQRMLVVTGVATLLQVWLGHRLPLLEGSAGMWWALFVLLATMSAPGEKGTVLQQLELGMIVAGAVLILISFLPIMARIRDLFTPLVTGVYLVLLVVQLSGPFFKGMLGITATGKLDWRMTLLSLLVIVVTLTISLKGKGLLRSMGPLFGIASGWLLFGAFGLVEPHTGATGQSWFALPELFAWGAPVWDFGIILTSVLTGLILISNVVASILVVGKSIDAEISAATYRRGLLGNGISGLLSGGFAVIGLVPLSVSAGFISTTGIRSRKPFVIGAVLVTLSGLFPLVGNFFATLPSEVAYAALFVPFSQMIGFGVRDLMGVEGTPRNLMVIGLSLMVGSGFMFLPPSGLSDLAPWLRNLFANGLLMGLLLCLLLEHVIFREKRM